MSSLLAITIHMFSICTQVHIKYTRIIYIIVGFRLLKHCFDECFAIKLQMLIIYKDTVMFPSSIDGTTRYQWSLGGIGSIQWDGMDRFFPFLLSATQAKPK